MWGGGGYVCVCVGRGGVGVGYELVLKRTLLEEFLKLKHYIYNLIYSSS